MKKVSLILGITIIFMLMSPVNAALTPNDFFGPPPSEGKPVLSVIKWISEDQVRLGENITIHVNITNWSDKGAHNLTISEPIFNNWSRTNFVGYDAYKYITLDSNASVSYSYTMTLINEGNYTIEPTSINYTDENGTIFSARSSFISLFVFVEEPLPDLSVQWATIFWLSFGILSIPIAVLMFIRFRR